MSCKVSMAVAAWLVASSSAAQTTNDPFPTPINTTDGVVTLNFRAFATLPDVDGQPARMMLLVDEPGTAACSSTTCAGRSTPSATTAQDRAVRRCQRVRSGACRSSRAATSAASRASPSIRSSASAGTPGFGKFYTLTDTSNTTPAPDFKPGGGTSTHDTVLLEWTAKSPSAATYDGGPPRELIRFEQPFANHNGGHLTFNPLAAPGSADYGLLYMGFADGGSGGDP